MLPWSSQPHFADLFEQIEQNRDELGVDSFGVSITTLEEVFMKLAYEEQADEDREAARSNAAAGGVGGGGGAAGAPNSEASPADVELDLLPTSAGSGGGGGGAGGDGAEQHAEGAAGVAVGAPWPTQVRALLRRRLKSSLRDPSFVFQIIFLPLIVVLISGVFSAIPTLDGQTPKPLPLSAHAFRPPEPMDVRGRPLTSPNASAAFFT